MQSYDLIYASLFSSISSSSIELISDAFKNAVALKKLYLYYIRNYMC